ncbi:MAG: oligosaccharide flippase family protein [Gemmatimonadota bacterium]|nr:oligosaccharide flippase family protein [Gemmatimonadota bacterium]
MSSEADHGRASPPNDGEEVVALRARSYPGLGLPSVGGHRPNSLGKNISANLLSNGWSTLLSLVLTPVYVRLLGVESYGLIGFYLSWVAILGILDMAISATALRELAWLSARPQERAMMPPLLRTLEVVYWAIVGVLGIGLFASAWLYGPTWLHSKNLSPELVRGALMLMSLSLVVQVPSGLYIGGLMGLQRQVECSALIALFGTVRGVGAVLALSEVYPDIRIFFLWQLAASALQTFVLRWALWTGLRMDDSRPKFSFKMLQSVKGFAGGMVLITGLSVVMTQADKLILSRVVSLEVFGFYMLAWTVASGLYRIATPLTLAFGPHFTELVSRGDDQTLAKRVRLASQLMNVVVLPPAALLVFLSNRILFAWIGDQAVAVAAAPILAITVVGTALSACSYPALSILYSKKQLRPVIAVNVAAVVVLLPLLIVAAIRYGVLAGAVCWGFYGLTTYIAYQISGLRDIPETQPVLTRLLDFAAPCAASLAVAGIARYWLGSMEGRLAFGIVLGFCVVLGWFAALFVCTDLLTNALIKLKWKTSPTL